MPSIETNRILKANDVRGLGSKIVFNYDDLQLRCDDHLRKIREQTRQMIEDAQAEAAQIRSRAYEAAKAEGLRQGMSDADAEIERRASARADQKAADKLSTLLPAMQQASEALVREHDRWLADWESAAVRLSVAIAEKLVRHELQVNPESATEMIAEALQLAAGSPQINLLMNPRDIKRLGDHAEQVVKSMAACGEAKLVADESISCGGCVIESQHGQIDARLETLLERIKEELIAQPS